MEVKMFVSDRPEIAEESINEWLKKYELTVHQIAQSQSERNGKFVFVFSVFYSKNWSGSVQEGLICLLPDRYKEILEAIVIRREILNLSAGHIPG